MLNRFSPFKQPIIDLNPKTAGRAVWNGGIRLDRAENPFPPSPAVVEALNHWAGEANRYPEPSSLELRVRLSEYVGCNPAQLLIGNGSDELIDTIIRCCVNLGDEIVTPAPSFYFYHRSCTVNGGCSIFVPTAEGMELDVNAVLGGITARTKAVFIANPNNPTGYLASRETLKDLILRCPCLIVIDECYWEFSGLTVADWIDNYPHLIVLRSFSKAFGLAGMRLGYAIANQELIERLYSAMQPFPISGAAQAVGLAVLIDLPYMRSNVAFLIAERARIVSDLLRIGFRCYPTATNFVLVETSRLDMTATEIAKRLIDEGIYVWDCTGSPGAGINHLRITMGSKTDNDQLLEALRVIVHN